MNTQKKTYEKPFAEVVKVEAFNHLLDWSAPKGLGPGEGRNVEIESKWQSFDDWGEYDPKFKDVWE